VSFSILLLALDEYLRNSAQHPNAEALLPNFSSGLFQKMSFKPSGSILVRPTRKSRYELLLASHLRHIKQAVPNWDIVAMALDHFSHVKVTYPCSVDDGSGRLSIIRPLNPHMCMALPPGVGGSTSEWA
jgi:hypothetical protein